MGKGKGGEEKSERKVKRGGEERGKRQRRMERRERKGKGGRKGREKFHAVVIFPYKKPCHQ